jgi:hypothetical protein
VAVETGFAFPEPAGRYMLRFDLLVAGVAWFSQRGSPTTDLELAVDWSDSRDPHRFEALIEPLPPFPPRVVAGSFPLRLRLTNRGDTVWLPGPSNEPGTVRVGVQRLADDGSLAERDFERLPLPCAVAPHESVEIDARVAVPEGFGRRFEVDLVAEGLCWFIQHGSKPLSFTAE